MSAIVPVARCEMTVRPAVAGDYPFVDRLQDIHSKAVGFMRKAALEGKIALGEVLIAEEVTGHSSLVTGQGEESLPPSLTSDKGQVTNDPRIGYCISSNRYLKRDELGVIYQMNISPTAQRKLVAATLLKAVFERAPYGCKLFCCWCAQDLDANYFWESMGFVPLAFRTGAVGKKTRTHIFWQKRVREGDTTTPYWFPSKTDGGMMREDRLVLPIPPGVHWKDEMPVLLPVSRAASPCLEDKGHGLAARDTKKSEKAPTLMPPTRRGARFGPPSGGAEPEQVIETAKIGKKKREKKPARAARPAREKVKADPRHVAAARELRDRYLEQINTGVLADGTKVLPPRGPRGAGKYEVSRAIEASPVATPLLLEQAA